MRFHLITGASRGIGLELTKQYLELGDSVYACCRSPETARELGRLETQFSERLTIVELDVTRADHIQRLVDQFKKENVQLDTLILNAGVALPEAFGKWSEEAFLATLKTNLIAPALVAQALVGFLKPEAKVVNISSRIGSFDAKINLASDQDAYAISKSALNMLTMRLAAKEEMQGKVIVAISPGWVRTDMGGPQATLSVEESARGIIKTIESLSSSLSGSFLSIDGAIIPW